MAPVTLLLFEKPCVKCPGCLCLNNTKAQNTLFKICTKLLTTRVPPASTMPQKLRQLVLPVVFIQLGRFHYSEQRRGHTLLATSFCVFLYNRVDRYWQLASFCFYIRCSNTCTMTTWWPVNREKKKEIVGLCQPTDFHSQTTREWEDVCE